MSNKIVQSAILIVDDHSEIADLLQSCLKRRKDYFVAVAYEGNFALRMLGSVKIDVLISDQNMPGITGLELARKAKILQPKIKVILHSAITPSREVCLSSGVDVILEKPVILAVMFEEVERLLAISQEKSV